MTKILHHNDALPMKILDGEITLELRGGSSIIQARWKSELEGRRYERISTETSNIDKAKEKAKEAYKLYTAHVITGMPLESERTVKFVAEQYIASLGKKADLPKQQRQYISAIENYIIPLLGSVKITGVNKAQLELFNQKRDEKMGKIPKKGTVAKHNTAIRRIFEFGVDKKYCARNDMPFLTVKGVGQKSVPRPAFTDDEIKKIWDKFDEWIALTTRGDVQYRRKLLKLMCFFMYKIGCRPGNEIEELKWSCLQTEENGEITLHIHKSKYEEKERTIIMPYKLLKTLDEVGQLTGKTKPDDYIFCSPAGKKLVEMSVTFKDFLVWAKLRQAKTGKYKGENRALYSFRHTFATQQVRELTIGEITDMAEYMGTSAEMIVRFYVESNSNKFARDHVVGSFVDGVVEFYKDGKTDNAGFDIARLYSQGLAK